ncbi:hypothetical protein ACQR1I_35875 [Bradyrhizobium sp. HKCCYLS2038]|uniref:LPD3 domain-containing protein n=1 Tax=Bradyrhizobium sp. HKCCYLS2038 TaxID=3420764 RepID=UPI003EB8169F
MDTIADYTAWKAKQQQTSVEAATAVLSSLDASPDQVAGDLNLANDFGKATGNPVPPAPMVQEYRPVFQQAIEREKNRTILSNAPRLTEWLRNPENAAVARDDLSGLSWWETALGAGQNALSRGVRRIPQSFNQYLAGAAAQRAQDANLSFGEILRQQTGSLERVKDGQPTGEFVQEFPNPETLPIAAFRYAQSRLATMFGIDEKKSAESLQQKAGLIAKQINEIALSPAGETGRSNWQEASKENTLSAYMQAIAKDPGSFTAFVAETAAESLPTMAAAIGVAAVTRSPTAGAVTMGASSALTEAGTTPVEFFRENGIDVSTPEGAAKAIGSPELMREAVKRGDVRGLVIGIMDGMSGGVASQTLAKSHAGNMVLQALTQAVMGSAGEFGGQVLSGQQLNLGDILLEGLAEFAGAPAEVAGMAGSRVMSEARKAKDAGDRRALFQALSGQAQSSLLRNRMPEKFRQFVEAATANGPVENVYVPADQFVQYFQGLGVDPYALVDELDGVTRDDLDAAIAGGGDLQIPTATYAAKIAGSEHDAFLMDNMRFDPDQFTAKEAAEFNARAHDALQEAYDVAEQVRQEGEQLRSFEQEIYDTMVSRLRSAGRSTDVATTEAMLYPAFYRVMAERSGMTTEEFLQRYPLPQVQGDIPQGIQYKDVNELNRTLAEARSRKTARDNRQTLLEFIDQHGGINDIGGELKARNAETVSRGKGKKTLKLARKGIVAGARDLFGGGGGKKHSADEVARAAIDAGFLAEDPVANEYRKAIAEGHETPDITGALWGAIDRELRGEPQYSANEQADAAAARNAELDQIEQYLSGLGVTLADDDATIKQALEGARQYAQENSRAWMDAILAKGKERKQLAADLAASGKAVRLSHADGLYALAGPDMSKPGMFRLTRFDKDGPVGHTEHRTLADAVEEGLRMKYSPPYNSTLHLFQSETAQSTARALLPLDVQEFAQTVVHRFERLEAARERLNSVATEVSQTLDQIGETVDYLYEVSDELNAFSEDLQAFAEHSPDAVDLFELASQAGQIMRSARRTERFTIELSQSAPDEDPLFSPEQISRVEDLQQTLAELYPQVEQLAESYREGARGMMKDVASLRHDVEQSPSISDEEFIRLSDSLPDAEGWVPLRQLEDKLREFAGEVSAMSERGGVGRQYGQSQPALDVQIDPDTAVPVVSVPQVEAKSWADEIAWMKEHLQGKTFAAPDGRSVRVSQQSRKAISSNRGDARKAAVLHALPQVIANAPIYATAPDNRGRENLSYAYAAGMVEIEGQSYAIGLRYRVSGTGDAIFYQLEGYEFGPGGSIPADASAADPSAQASPGPSAAVASRKIADVVDAIKGSPLFQSGGPGPRGSIQFPAAGIGNGDTVIRLFQTADLSTMLHESGHYFLTVMQDLAARGEAGAAADYSVVKDWWSQNAADVAKDAMRVMPDVQVTAEDVQAALANGTTGDVMKDAAVDVGMQEQWARAFETYLMEGKAPSADLRSAFEKFRAWLLSVYRRLAGLNVKVSDDIRTVFDRMIATDHEIAKAAQETGDAGPVFATAEQMGLTDEQYAAFLKLRDQAQEEAKARLLRETMEPIKRQQEKWYKEERKAVRAEVERDVNSYPVFRALEWMGNRRWFGEGQPEEMPDIRLSKDALVERYGEGVLKTLPRGKQTVYTVEGGLDPDEAAGWFGFGSGDEMVKALEKTLGRKAAIDAETDRVMRDRHGDALHDGDIEARALDAVHAPDKRGLWIAAELKAVVEVAGQGKAMTMKEARASARETIAKMRVRDAMNANRFLSAERKAADEAARLGAQLAREKIWLDAARRKIGTAARAVVRGEASADAVASAIEANNAKFETKTSTYTAKGVTRSSTSLGYNDLVAKLIDAKRRQLLNHAFYSEARKVADEVERAERFVDKLGKKAHRERIAGAGRRDNAQVDYLAAIDELLERYDFRQMSGVAEQRRGSLSAFVAAMTAAGRENELAIPEKVLADAARKPYKTLPVEELRGVVDSLKNLEHIALRWDKLIDAQQEREFSAAAESIAEAINSNLPKRPPGAVKSKAEQARNTARAYLDSVLNATTLLREFDGFKDRGAVYRSIKAPIDEAQNRLIVRKQEAAKALENLYAAYSKEQRRAMAVREHMPALNMALSKWERIAIALNTGNDGNLKRLTDPRQRRPLTMDQVNAVLATLDARDADFVQSVWDYIGSFKADIAARERRATGVEPAWVDPSPVMIGGKQLAGGYYPIKYDTRLSSVAADRETVDIAQSLAAGRFGKAQTRNGHLKERAAAGDGSIDLDMAVMHRHVNQVIYDLEMSEPVANAWRLIQDGRVRSALDDAGRSSDFDALQAWLKDAAEGELAATSPVGAVLRGLKSNFTAAKLAFNISNAILQVAGVAQSFVVVGKKDMALGIAKVARNPAAAARAVAEKSPFMATRQTTFNKDVMDFLEDSTAGATASRVKEFKKSIWGPLSFWLMQKVQWHFADVPTWIAGYEQGMRRFGDEAVAVAHADGLVKRAQASGLFVDRAGVERGSLSSRNRQNDVVKLFTTLGSYMFAKFNVAYERTATAKHTIQDAGVSAKSAQEVASWTLDMALLFTLEALVAAAIKGQLPGQGSGDDDESWLAWLAKNTAFSVLGTLPFIRDGVSALQGHGGGGAYGSVIEETAKGLISAGKVASAAVSSDSEVKGSDVKNIVNATGVATGAPTVFINRIVDAGWRQSEGESVSPLEYVFGKFKK